MVESTESAAHSTQMDNTVPISLKTLATHLEVGAIIGKAGSSISEIQQASDAKIQISGPNEVFPGTTERIMSISGEMLKVGFLLPEHACLAAHDAAVPCVSPHLLLA
jgi:polyribonucleotide nucleotidyltransferase